MADIPRDPSFDGTRAFLSEGYDYVSNRCERLNTDLFQTRLLLKRVYCTRGEEAARMFYSPGRFTRRGAVPPTTLRLLQGRGSVQTLDAAAHEQRKAMFLALLSPKGVERMTAAFEEEWLRALERWETRDEIVLQEEAEEILCRSVCRWAGIPLQADEIEPRTREFAAMIDGAGAFGFRNWRGIALRRRTEKWAQERIESMRNGEIAADPETAIGAISGYRKGDGQPLPSDLATTELLNVLRPTVAVARYITFAALALHRHPEARAGIETGDDIALEAFAHEVRRVYPFFPVIAGRAREAFTWRDVEFPKNAWVILDLYGTNHDPRSWEEPDAFRPERFRNWNGNPFNLIPQGAGDVATTHRCPGETLTVHLMKRATELLATRMRYDVPEQDLTIDRNRFPTLPASGFRMRRIRRSATAGS